MSNGEPKTVRELYFWMKGEFDSIKRMVYWISGLTATIISGIIVGLIKLLGGK
jgi:hypothetical protein